MRKILLLVAVVAACGRGLEPEPICARSLVGLCGTVRFRGAVPANTENVFIAAYLAFPQTCTELINNRRPVIPGSVPFTDSLAAYGVPLDPGAYHWVLAVWKKPGTLTLSPADTQYLRVAGRFAAKHTERLGVLERKLANQREELALAQRELDDMQTQLKSAERDRPAMETRASVRDAGQAEAAVDLQDELLKSDMDRASREAAAARQLEELKKKMRKE